MRHLEDDLQVVCVRWFDMQHNHLSHLLFHPANGGRRNAREAARFKKMGVRAGVSDLVLLVPAGSYHGLCVELKCTTKQTAAQKEFQSKVESQGYRYAVIRNIESFMEVINEYLV